ncbi:HD domain-containing protein [Arcicella sp. LKC2W]|uniref:HD domain-containing protein n=1 Tax=Arcicella sp. LKC2W TaxID=2984198 RepID=UPI002B1F6416|nr:HD domain-containing protein [Arcicella sp. LKC2W]MEA5460596.1 HD domain-containing protein [Arcicella sp. LKC2W]
MVNKRKIINDPVYGFINITTELIYDLIEHPYYQRLRRIKQLGMAEFVYPGALHTRFHHALGAMHLMNEALQTLSSKGHYISEEELESAQIAILLHDVGHGPFSHVLEHLILNHVPHEQISFLLMNELNKQFEGKLSLAIKMFTGEYERAFFHQLISSQLDVDRMDYLNRDSFFTGVREGFIGADRILKMLDVIDNQLVVEQKGIYSIENFLTARRLMYWQVYLHKTSICAETMLTQIIRRARELIKAGEDIFATESFGLFLKNDVTLEEFVSDKAYLKAFTEMDDHDIWACIKVWTKHPDYLLSGICQKLLERKLYKIIISDQPFEEAFLEKIKNDFLAQEDINHDNLSYFMVQGVITNEAYLSEKQAINILTKNKLVVDIADASDLPTIKALSNVVKKYYICWAKDVYLRE